MCLKFYIVFILILSILLVRCAEEEQEQDLDLPERCQYLLKVDTMRRSCTGHYPNSVSVKYQDTFVKPGEMYSLFLGPDSYDSVVILKRSPLHTCVELKQIYPLKVACINETGGEVQHTFKLGMLQCFPFHLRLLDDLMKSCIIQNNYDMVILRRTKIMVKRSAMLYIFLEDLGAKSDTAFNYRLVLLIIFLYPVFFVFAIFLKQIFS